MMPSADDPSEPDSPRRSLQSLLVEHLPLLQAFIRARMGARIKARESVVDVVQSVCGEVLSQADQFEFRSVPEFRAWLLLIAKHRLANKGNFHARKRRSPECEIPIEAMSDELLLEAYGAICTPSRFLADKEAIQQIDAALADLPDNYRDAIELRRLGGLEYEDIAQELGRSVGAVRNLVHRGLARLAAKLDDAEL